MLAPLQFGGVPGGVELLIIGLIFLLILALPLGLVVVVVWALRRRRGRVEELEARVAELEGTLDEELASGEGSAAGGADREDGSEP
ncbi:MAG: hypothetical protein ABEJ67_06670 [Halanaeroarchaeum sp.]